MANDYSKVNGHPFEARELALTDRALYVILVSKLLYSGIASVALTYVVGTTVLRWTVPSGSRVLALVEPRWAVLVFLVTFVTVGGGLGIWTVLAWVTASLFCPSVRDAVQDRHLFDEL